MLKKSKEYKKELSNLEEPELTKRLTEIVIEFIKEFANGNKTHVEIINKLKELDNKFQASLPKHILDQRHLFRRVIMKDMPGIKNIMMW